MTDNERESEGDAPKATGLNPDMVKIVRQMSDEAEETRKTGKQLGLGPLSDDEGTAEPGAASTVTDLQNPNQSHRLYYAVQGLLKKHLPPGKENEELRRYVYDEKNLYINRGKDLNELGIRGSDGRMAYIPHLKTALALVKKWVAEGGTAFDVFVEFWNLNEAYGYHKKPEGGDAPKPKRKTYEGQLGIGGTLDDVLRAAVRDEPKPEE